jgi:hypothetical protein
MFQGATAHHHATASASNRFSSFGVLIVMVFLDSKPSGVAPGLGVEVHLIVCGTSGPPFFSQRGLRICHEPHRHLKCTATKDSVGLPIIQYRVSVESLLCSTDGSVEEQGSLESNTAVFGTRRWIWSDFSESRIILMIQQFPSPPCPRPGPESEGLVGAEGGFMDRTTLRINSSSDGI